MSFTNKTEHYDLPQYIASDKPTYLVDFNGAMQKIDSTMYSATQNAEQAVESATSASNKVDETNARVDVLEEKATTQGNAITSLQNSNSLLTQRITAEEVKGQQQDVKIQNVEASVAQASESAEEATTNISALESKLTANNTPFIYDYQNGQYGYNTDPARGADTFHPFKSASVPAFDFVSGVTVNSAGSVDFVVPNGGNYILVVDVMSSGTNAEVYAEAQTLTLNGVTHEYAYAKASEEPSGGRYVITVWYKLFGVQSGSGHIADTSNSMLGGHLFKI